MVLKIILSALLLGFFALVFPLRAVSCPIPVYRYALEFWEPDAYRATVYHSGALSRSMEDAFKLLDEVSTGMGAAANIEVRLVDVEDEERLLDYPPYDEDAAGGRPWVVLQYPYIEGINKPVWEGPLTDENAEALIYSPAREHLSARLSEGIKVWVLLESGNREKDREALETLERELDRLEQVLELPDPGQWWTGREEAERPEIKFEAYSVSRDDASEAFLISMLLGSEDDLADFGSEPIVFPVYGRGIALWAIVGKGINAWNITDAAEFLTGPCSCQVKMLNPGVDLLIYKDWEGAVEQISDEMLASRAPATGFEGFQAGAEEAERRLEEKTRDEGEAVYLDGVLGREPEEEERPAGGFSPAVIFAVSAVIIIGFFMYLYAKVFRNRKP